MSTLGKKEGKKKQDAPLENVNLKAGDASPKKDDLDAGPSGSFWLFFKPKKVSGDMEEAKEEEKKKKLKRKYKIPAIILAVLSILAAVAVLVACSSTIFIIEATETNQTGRESSLCALLLLALVVTGLNIGGLVQLLNKRHLTTTIGVCIAFGVMAMAQVALSIALAVPSHAAAAEISRAMTESFFLATDPKHDKKAVAVWDFMQSSMSCCGIHSPEDYKAVDKDDIPEVPFSCCPVYNLGPVDAGALLACRYERTYFNKGCRFPLIEVFTSFVNMVTIWTLIHVLVTVPFFVLVLLSVRGEREDDSDDNGNSETAGAP